MIEIKNFDLLSPSGISYGGHSGSKKGVIIDNEKWFLKYPKSTKSMEVENLSYTTSPLSEYLGSEIYKTFGIDTHETKLGIADGKLVVACKDFLISSEVIIDYNSIKNDYDVNIEKAILELPSSSSSSFFNEDIEELFIIMENNHYFKKIPELKKRFWDMFVVDAFISNNDRNEANWGLILDKETNNLRVAPVFDNGASFYTKSSDERLMSIYEDDLKIKQSVYDSSISAFKKNGKKINPLKFIESMENKDCNEAIIRNVPKIDFNKMEEIFNEVPEICNNIPIFGNVKKLFYLKSLKYKYENVLLPTYNKLMKKCELEN